MITEQTMKYAISAIREMAEHQRSLPAAERSVVVRVRYCPDPADEDAAWECFYDAFSGYGKCYGDHGHYLEISNGIVSGDPSPAVVMGLYYAVWDSLPLEMEKTDAGFMCIVSRWEFPQRLFQNIPYRNMKSFRIDI